MNLEYLNDDVLILIFGYLANDDLITLSNVSLRFEDLIENRIFSVRTLDLLMAGTRSRAVDRTYNNFTCSKRLQLYKNWLCGRFEEHIFFHQQKFFPIKLILDKNFVYLSRGGQIRSHRRTKDRHLDKLVAHKIGDIRDPEINCFVKKGDVIFAGRASGDGVVFCDGMVDVQRLHHFEDINSVDFYEDIFVTTSNSCTKIWEQEKEFGMQTLNSLVHLDESFFNIQINPFKGGSFAGGKFKDLGKTALKLVDIETHKIITLGSQTSAVYHLLWKDENCILTANFDTSFRLFDCRSNRDEIIWEDPYDASVYSLDFDGRYGVLCGMKYHCRVNLYDLRMQRNFVQMYFPSLKRHPPSPVYSVASDASQLFIATGYNIRIIDFDADWAQPKDYSHCFQK